MRTLIRTLTGNRCRYTWLDWRNAEIRCTRLAGHTGKHRHEFCI